MARIQDILDNKCPNCGDVEKADHFNRCPSEARTELLHDSVNDLERWMLEGGKRISSWRIG